MNYRTLLATALLLLTTLLSHADGQETASTENTSSDETSATAEQQEYMAWAKNIWESLDRQTGQIKISQANATLNVPENFYYLDSKDAEKVLVEVWGNPPGQNVLGMIFPAEQTPFDTDSWAVTIEYEEEGYVSDEDADKIDYDDLLKEMKKDTQAASEYRVEQGFPSIELVGWAATPFYDGQTKKLHWAKEIKFGESSANTLNYNIRVLGRKGVLVLNFIAGMEQKAIIEQNLDGVIALADFDEGSTYADFDPDVDKVAAYGLGALVAGKVLAKTGFFAIALIFLKKFGIYIVIGLGILFKGLFSRKKKDA